MITGIHALFYATDAERVRAFFRGPRSEFALIRSYAIGAGIAALIALRSISGPRTDASPG